MPHLAPLAWALAPLLFWGILLSLSASLWWTSYPSFPPSLTSSPYPKFSTWNWK
uniref:ATP synthase F0 subunit 8 n=1 Tax=Aurospio banyulensis TaxID=3050091 RepID=A0AAU6QHD9_9ANNE